MSMIAINAALTASSAANNAAAQAAANKARVDRCIVFESRFDAAKASAAEKQEYASCVETLYPQPISNEGIWLIKGAIVILILAVVIGGIYGYREFRDGAGIFMGAILGPCLALVGMVLIAAIAVGIGYLFS